MNIQIHKIPGHELKKKPNNDSQLGFGKIFTDYMFVMHYTNGNGWHNPEIKKFENISLPPSAVVLHYAQAIFEGLKAYYRVDGSIGLFRPDKNFVRLNRSADRMCMPRIPEEDQKKAVIELLKIERDWVPKAETTSLYVRPTMIAVDPSLSVKASSTYIFFIIVSPSGVYYSGELLPISVYVTEEYTRAAYGGTGTAKTGGNYAASLLIGKKAEEKGCDQVLWLDPREKQYIDEVGSMNICFVYGKKVITSALSGTILEGVTRDSVILLARDLGYEIEERAISIDEVIESIESGVMTECFGCGTAAVISPIGTIVYRDKTYTISEEPGGVSKRFFKELADIQHGRTEDRFGWTTIVE